MNHRSNPSMWDHQWYPLRELVSTVRREIRPATTPQALLVDFGCGNAPYQSILESKGYRYKGFDIDSSLHKPDVTILGENEGLPFGSGEVEAVCSFQVLEHVWDVGAYLQEAKRVLKSNGTLYLSTHGVWLYHAHPNDFRRWTKQGLHREIEAHGFRVEKIVPLLGPMAWTAQFRLLGVHMVLSKLGWLGGMVRSVLFPPLNLWVCLLDKLTPDAFVDRDASIYFVIAKRD